MKKYILKIMFWSAIALIIPILGNQFVEGWNWGPGEFIFAWIFFVVMSLTIRWAVSLASVAVYRIAIGIAVFLCFVSVWVMLARG